LDDATTQSRVPASDRKHVQPQVLDRGHADHIDGSTRPFSRRCTAM
jgi:hypothetical protein